MAASARIDAARRSLRALFAHALAWRHPAGIAAIEFAACCGLSAADIRLPSATGTESEAVAARLLALNMRRLALVFDAFAETGTCGASVCKNCERLGLRSAAQ